MNDIEEMDKCTEVFSLKIPEVTKIKVDKLPPAFKKKLNIEILITISRILHEAEFRPSLYLKSE